MSYTSNKHRTVDAGQYRNTVIIEVLNVEYDNVGNPVKKWKKWKKAKCSANGLYGSEYWEAAHTQNEDNLDLIFRWKKYMEYMNTREFRIVFKEEIFNILTIDNIKYKNEQVKMRCKTTHERSCKY